MKRIRINDRNADAAIDSALTALRNGGLVVMPTDTVYGIAAMPDNEAAIKKLFAVKKRDNSKPIAMLASGWKILADRGIRLTKSEMRLAKKFWPGPLTLILKAGKRREGIRVPDNVIARMLLRKAGGLLRVTSANISGRNPALTVDSAVKELGGNVDVYLDAGRSKIGVASTVVEMKGKKPVMLREGALSVAAISKALSRFPVSSPTALEQ